MNRNHILVRVSIPIALLSLAISTTTPLAASQTPFCFGDGSIGSTACPCANIGTVGNGCANSLTTSGGNLTSLGVAGTTVGTDTLVLAASNLIPGGTGIFFCGTARINGGAGLANGDGLRCVSGSINRLGVALADSVSGIATYPLPGQPQIHVIAGTVANDVRYVQYWYRDANALFCTSSRYNFTNGVEITFVP